MSESWNTTSMPLGSIRNRSTSVEVLIGRLLWAALFSVLFWFGAS